MYRCPAEDLDVELEDYDVEPSVDASADDVDAVLDRTRELLEQGWCQGAGGKNADGVTVPSHSADAVAWCVSGAMQRATHDLGLLQGPENRAESWSVYFAAIHRVSALLTPERWIDPDEWGFVGDPLIWNDEPGRTKEDVILAVKEARENGS